MPDEDPRDAFERTFKMPKHVTRCGTGYAVTAYSAWLAHDFVRMWEGWNACRAAMLQGAEPASNCDELPLDYLQGHKDGLEWAAQLAKANHPETGDWLYDDPIELSKAIRKGPDMPLSDGNSPVIQDGWIKCSERMPDKYDFDIWVFSPSKGIHDGIQWDGCEFADDEYQFKINDVSHWMKKYIQQHRNRRLSRE